MATNFDIINAALTRTGNEPITSFSEGTTPANIAAANYDILIENELASYRWRAATKTAHLNRIDGDPGLPWTDAYQLPSDLVLVRSVFVDGVAVDYEQQGDKVLALTGEDADVVVKYVWGNPESAWPGLFREAIIQRLEALFLRAISHSYDEAEARDKAANGTFMRARVMDAQGSTPTNPFESSTLRARRA
jgi:hypothetical protein